MLRAEPDTKYVVYPSWAELSYKWADLPRLLANPLESGYLDPTKGWWALGYPDTIAPCSFIDGPFGGGIVVADHVPRMWMPALILQKEANLCRAEGQVVSSDKLPCWVGYLEPYDDPLLNALEGKQRTRNYLCSATLENIEAEPESHYWVIAYEGKSEPDGLGDLPTWARCFELEVSRAESISQPLRQETSDWFRNPKQSFAWYTVRNYKPLVGYCYALVVYLALHLRKIAGRRMRSMHMLASIERKPNIRKFWPRR
ncbi:MAG TPA: hypothetical protein VGN12_04180 [Pirellulales bacterium]|jgi:hypothetical protein